MRPGVDKELQKLLERKPPDFGVRVAADQSACATASVAGDHRREASAGAEVADLTDPAEQPQCRLFTRLASADGGETTVVEVPVEDGENTIRVTGTNQFRYLTERSVTRRPQGREKGNSKALCRRDRRRQISLLTDACGGRPCDLRATWWTTPPPSSRWFLKRDCCFPRSNRWFWSTRRVRYAAGFKAGVTILEPDSDTIDDQLADLLDKPGENDTTIVFVAGHGINIDEDYYFIPTDGESRVPTSEAVFPGRLGRHPEIGRAPSGHALHAARHPPRQRLR